MHFLYTNLSVLVLGAITGLMGWLYGGTQAGVLVPVVPWLFLFAVEILMVFPQRLSGESSTEARERVGRALKRDPLFWVSLVLLLILSIPFVNNGLCVCCDYKLIAQGFSPDPPAKFLPYCVNRMQHLNVFFWFAAALPLALAVKHCLTRRGKRLFIEFVVWNGFALAILGFVQTATEAPGPFWQPFTNVDKGGTFFSTFGYPNMAGDYFTTLFGLAAALWRRHNDEVREAIRSNKLEKKTKHSVFWQRHYMVIPTLLFFYAALNTLSRAAIILVSCLAVIYFVHALVSTVHRFHHRAQRVRFAVITLAIAAVFVFFSVISIPEDMQREVDTLNADAVITRVTGKGEYHTTVAARIWRKNLLFGCGGWGYKHFCVPNMTKEEVKKLQQVGGINVHNDYLQFLAEHGIVGFGLIVTVFILLLLPLFYEWRMLIAEIRFADKKDLPAKPVQIFVLPAGAFYIFMTTIATIVHGFGDCPLRSPAVLTLFFSSLAALPGFLPKAGDEEEESTEHHHHHHHHHASR